MSAERENRGEFLLYKAPDGAVRVEVCFRDESVWLTQKALAELFGVQRPAVTKHLQKEYFAIVRGENPKYEGWLHRFSIK